MIPETKNLSIYRGDAFEITLVFRSDDGVTRSFDDLTGLDISAKCKESTDIDADLVFSFRVDRDDDVGFVRLYLLPDDTKQIESGKYKWDLQIGDYTKLVGNVQIIGDVS